MSISLVKGQKISLEKGDGSSLTKIYLGAGWDVAKSGGFLGGLFGGGGGDSIDLDASVIIFDENNQPL
ncbi:MAG: TerD family protein, partial [Acinetobacter sp.]|nr:TerD family protein [Acinetobacter sp.]